MNKKLIVIDLDGTLLKKDETLGEYSQKILSRLINEGHIIILASGRPTRSLLPIYKQISCNAPIISYNGAVIYNPSDNTFPLIKKSIPAEFALKIINEGKNLFTSIVLDDSFYLYSLRIDNYLKKYFPYEGINTKFGQINSFPNKEILSCVLKTSHTYDEELKELLHGSNKIKLRHWRNSFYSELYLEDVNKGNALEYIQDYYKIKKEDCIGFGDSFNDLSMLERVGQAFAMKNAKSRLLLEKFNVTKKSNSQEGVAHTLANLFGF
mgnify:CR=1 FL=1